MIIKIHNYVIRRTLSVLPLASPGQEVQLKFMNKLLSQPNHPTTRQLLHDTYGIPESMGHTHRTRRKKRQERVSGCTVGPLTRLPMNNRRDAVVCVCTIHTRQIPIHTYRQIPIHDVNTDSYTYM